MSASEIVEFTLEVGEAGADQEQLDALTRTLWSELQETEVESADLVKGATAPSGSKAGEAITIGSIAITVLPTLLPKIVETIQGWLMRGSNRTVKFKGKINGQTVDFEGSSEDLAKLLASLDKKPKKKK